MPENKKSMQLVWGVLLLAAGLGVFIMTPQKMREIEKIAHFSAYIPFIWFCFYFMGALLQHPDYGEDFFRQLAANAPVIQTNTEATARIAAGEMDIGITIDFTVRKLLSENPDAPIDLVYPETGVVMVPSPIAIFKSSSNVEGAKAFERYILSLSGQTLLRDLAGVVPVRLDVRPPTDIESITQLQVIRNATCGEMCLSLS